MRQRISSSFSTDCCEKREKAIFTVTRPDGHRAIIRPRKPPFSTTVGIERSQVRALKWKLAPVSGFWTNDTANRITSGARSRSSGHGAADFAA